MESARKGEITELLRDWSAGSTAAEKELMPIIYDALHRLAGRLLRAERQSHTLEPPALVSETYLRLIDQSRVEWKNRQQFFALAARTMRRVLVDYARRRTRLKRGGDWLRVEFDEATRGKSPDWSFLPLHEALVRLEQIDQRKSRVVEMRFFGGMSAEESAAALGCSAKTVRRDWTFARAWLARELA